jgi:SAM-dependent methyltransferase
MPTMPPPSPTGQPDRFHAWFRSGPGRALLDSERALVAEALDAKPGRPWLWLGPCTAIDRPTGRGLALSETHQGWTGSVTCALPLPLPSEAFCTVVLQHPSARPAQVERLLDESARILEPGGRLWLFALNPLAPYRWRWRGFGLRAPEPWTWRRRLRLAGLRPDPVSRGIGPCWRIEACGEARDGAGLRAAYVIRAEKRSLPLTPVRGRRAIRLAHGATPG